MLKYHRLSYHLLCDRTIINLLIRIQNVLKEYIDAMVDLLIMSINKIPIAPGALEQSTNIRQFDMQQQHTSTLTMMHKQETID